MDPSEVVPQSVIVVEHVHRHVSAARDSAGDAFRSGYVLGLVAMFAVVAVVAAVYPDEAIRVVEKLSKLASSRVVLS